MKLDFEIKLLKLKFLNFRKNCDNTANSRATEVTRPWKLMPPLPLHQRERTPICFEHVWNIKNQNAIINFKFWVFLELFWFELNRIRQNWKWIMYIARTRSAVLVCTANLWVCVKLSLPGGSGGGGSLSGSISECVYLMFCWLQLRFWKVIKQSNY